MPVAARSKRVPVAPGELAARAEGDGEPLLLIAGLGQGGWVWQDAAPALAARHRVTWFDNRGTGRTPPPAHDDVAELADDAATFIDTPTDVLGFSMGGYVALTLALAHRDLVCSLILVSTGAGGPGRVPRPAHVARAFGDALGLPPAEFGRRTLPYTFAPGWAEANPERFEAVLAARLERPTPYETIEAHAGACYGFYAAACEVERIEVPALVVHGDEDLIVPVENGRRLAARLPNAQYVELSGRGHNLMLEDPETLVGLVRDFLAEGAA
jgi:pimeloyl-ACP methyl ester carboxylesterase